jgi:glucosamine 6-phosphate synthetase-like amidotransferase/phosphosugar isomerase protein
MCGIFGSTKFTEYQDLYIKNRDRGQFSYGCLYATKDRKYHTLKHKGVVNLVPHERFDIVNKCTTFLGHTQAPTSAQREWTEETSHPFRYKDWIIAHNGILENHEELKRTLALRSANVVDSSIIPEMLYELGDPDEIRSISVTFGELKGIFACWLYNRASGSTYLVRSGSTLYGNIPTGSFSSMKTKATPTVLDEGIIYRMSDEGLERVGGFSSKSPFFMI